MRVAYFDCPSGAAGDMIMGALVDAGVPFEALRDELAKLRLPGWSLERREVMKGVFRATKIDVHVHDHDHAGDAAGHSHAHGHDRHEHPDRNLRAILDLIAASDLPATVKANASRIFTRLGEAEARVHGTTVDHVHFHDVGAVDAIVDVTGACVGLHLLGVDQVHCSALPLGGGFVTGAHGRIPIPGPGTAELLKGFPVVDTGVRRELVTPTGAAILTTLARAAGAMPAMTVEAVGYGAGNMELDAPNVIRLFLGRAASSGGRETIMQVETTVDDMSPQLWEVVIERLFETGALDVYLTPVTMKKSRPGTVLTALCAPDRVTELSRVLFEESPTIGVRWTAYQRERLDREMVTLPTTYGAIPFKVSRLDGRVVTVTPEFDEVRRIARAKGLPVREVLDQARAEGRRLLA
ncbi:MAG: nickel pincer cofactor biosynthesis protein LarC [Candidatus Rokuibacteriota bacterium]|nr:MAG: nickel pincer cofactor biosynthesis protein LarC [Candidatus Rokubacteria bacterium]